MTVVIEAVANGAKTHIMIRKYVVSGKIMSRLASAQTELFSQSIKIGLARCSTSDVQQVVYNCNLYFLLFLRDIYIAFLQES